MKIPDTQLVTLGPWKKGLDDVADEAAVSKTALRKAINVVLDADGGVSRRPGYTELAVVADGNSLYAWQDSLLFVENGELIRYHLVSEQKIALVTGINSQRYMSYGQHGNELYYTNGEQSGRISATWATSLWGVPNPARQPTLTSGGAGALPSAQYQIAITYVNARGEESGTGVAAVISATGSIQLSGIPNSGEGYAVRVYMTPPNGDQFFAQILLASGVSSHTLYSFRQDGLPLTSQFLRLMPPGQIVRSAFGRLWVARDNRLLFSAALHPGMYAPLDSYFVFRTRIVVVEPLADGIWIATESQTFWLAGTEPDKMVQTLVSMFGAAEGSSGTWNGTIFSPKLIGPVAYWFSDRGNVLGLPGGQLDQFMEGIVAADAYKRGATLFREENGVQHMITAVRDKEADAKVRTTDAAEGFIRRNGIIIS